MGEAFKVFMTFLTNTLKSKWFWIIVISIAAIIIARHYINKLIESRDSRSSLGEFGKELNDSIDSGNLLTHTESWYKDAALRIWNALNNGAVNPTDEATIVSVFKDLNTKSDVLLLIKTFGLKKYNQKNWFDNTEEVNMTLPQHLVVSMEQWERDTYINLILKAKGIDFKF